MAKKSQGKSKSKGFNGGKGKQSKSFSSTGNQFRGNSERSGIASQIAGTLTSTATAAISDNKKKASNVQQNVSVGDQFYFPFQNRKDGPAPLYGTPGIMTIYYTPTFGYNTNSNSRIQKTADTLYQDIYAYLTTNVSFNSCDLVLYIVGLSELFAWTATLSRLVNVLGYKTWMSDYDRRGFVRALGFDYDDMIEHQTDLLMHINQIRTDLSGFALPPNAEYSARHEWLNSEIFLDEDNDAGQMYAFIQRTYLKLDTHIEDSGLETYRLVEISNPTSGADALYNGKGLVKGSQTVTNNTGTAIGYVENIVTPTFLTYNNIKNITSQLLNPFIGNVDMKIIRGYIAKAYAGHMRTIPVFENPTEWKPKYSQEALLQIENLTLVGHMDPDSSTLMEDATGKILLSQPRVNRVFSTREGTNRYCWQSYDDAYATMMMNNKLLNIHTPVITPEHVLWGTKMMNTVTWENDANWPIRTARTEVAEFALIWVTDYTYNQAASPNNFFQYSVPVYYYNKAMTTCNNGTSLSQPWYTLFSGLNTLINPRLQMYKWLNQFKQKPTTIDGISCVLITANADNRVYSYNKFAPDVCLDEFAYLTPEQLETLAETDLEDQFYPKY